MRTLPVLLACALLAGCRGDDRSAAASPPTLAAGEVRTFAPGDVVRCRARGILAEVVVERARARAFEQATHAWEQDGSSANLSLDFRPDGRIVATCGT